MEDKHKAAARQYVAVNGGCRLSQTFTVKYGFPPELNEEQLEVLTTMVLNRIDSIVTHTSFNRDTLALVHAHMTPSRWDEENGGTENFYRREAMMIDEMFSDVEDDRAYRSTLGDLARCQCTTFSVQLITNNLIFLELRF